MNISKSVQNYFQASGSNIQLDKTRDGEMPEEYASINSEIERGFNLSTHFEVIELRDIYLIDLLDKKRCLARAATFNFIKAKRLIFDWIENRIELDNMDKNYFAFDEINPINQKICKYPEIWNSINNFTFQYSHFYDKEGKNWMDRYNKMVNHIIKHKALSQL